MFLELRIGRRPRISVETWGLVLRIFLEIDEISTKNLEMEGNWDTALRLLGFHIDLNADSLQLRIPKIIGDSDLLLSHVFSSGNYTGGLPAI